MRERITSSAVSAPRPGHTHYSSSEYYLLSFSPCFVAKTNQISFGKEVGDGDNVDEPPAAVAELVPLMRALCSPAYRGKMQISLSRTMRVASSSLATAAPTATLRPG